MKITDKLDVLYHDRLVGRLSMNPSGDCCVFQYDSAWLRDGFSISPVYLPLRDELFIAEQTPFAGNFGIFDDSIPDGYGRYLIHKILKRKSIDSLKLSPVQYLSIVGNSGMGALCYVPESFIGEDKSLPQLDELQRMALELLSEKSDADAELLYFNSGNSGGCRPKCLMKDDEGEWLVKFRNISDPEDMGQMEFLYNQAARQAGIDVPDFKLIDGRYFASRRFDIENGERLHIATAGALLNESIHFPKLDYTNLLHLTGYLTQDSAQVEEMFRRMVFNVFFQNKDDHAKNFAYICREGRWKLAPAYDLTRCESGYNGEHATSVNGIGNPAEEDMIAVGTEIRISRKRCLEIIAGMREVVKKYSLM